MAEADEVKGREEKEKAAKEKRAREKCPNAFLSTFFFSLFPKITANPLYYIGLMLNASLRLGNDVRHRVSERRTERLSDIQKLSA